MKWPQRQFDFYRAANGREIFWYDGQLVFIREDLPDHESIVVTELGKTIYFVKTEKLEPCVMSQSEQ